MVAMYDTGPLPLSEQDFDQMAKHFKVTFPADYKAFMLQYNGGVKSEPKKFRYDNNQEEEIAWFYSIEPDAHADIIQENKMREGRLPTNFVSIGTNGAGDEICISCGEGINYGKVYYWDHNEEADLEDGETPDEAFNYSTVANSFTEFLNSLYSSKNE